MIDRTPVEMVIAEAIRSKYELPSKASVIRRTNAIINALDAAGYEIVKKDNSP